MTSLGVPVPTLVTRQNVVFGGRFLGTSCRRQPVSSISFLEKYPVVVAGNRSGTKYGTIESTAGSKGFNHLQTTDVGAVWESVPSSRVWDACLGRCCPIRTGNLGRASEFTG